MNTSGEILFSICALVAILSACGTIFSRAPIRAAMSLLVHIGALAVLFLTLSAHLLAAIQLIVYAGAVVVLFIFVIMVIGPTEEERGAARIAPFAKAISAAVMAMITLSIAGAVAGHAPEWISFENQCPGGTGAECTSFGSVEGLAAPLFTDVVVPFELVSILLLVAVLGAIVVAQGRTPMEAARLARERARYKAEDAADEAREQQLAADASAPGGQ